MLLQSLKSAAIVFLCMFISSSLFASARNGYYHKDTGANFAFFDGMASYGTPVIDGKIGQGEWNDEFARDIYKYDRDDNRIRYMFQYDSSNFYLAIQVDDDKLWDDSPGQIWETNQDDGVEIYIDPDNSRDAYLTSEDRVIAFTVSGRHYRFDCGNNSGSTAYYGELSQIQKAVGINGTVNNSLDVDSGYVVEVAVPWAYLGGSVPSAGYISLNIIVVEDDDGGPLDINYDETRWNQPFEIDRYFKWFGDGLNGPANYARICLLPANDTTPPSAVNDISLVSANPFSAVLAFTAPGDNAMGGESVRYHIRYSMDKPFNSEADWDAGVVFQNRFIPKRAGKNEELRITGLEPGTKYFVAIRAEDASKNLGLLSSPFSFLTPAAPAGYGKGHIYPSPAGRFFIYEDGTSFMPVTEPAGITWLGIRDLYNKPVWDETFEQLINWYGSVEAGNAEEYIQMLAVNGINLISIFVEDLGFANEKNSYAPDGVAYLEFPATVQGGYYLQETLDFIDNFMDLCGRNGIYVAISPFDTYFYKKYWDYNPYNSANGGVISSPDQFVTDPDAISAQKKRLEKLYSVVSKHSNFFGWNMINEWDNDTFASREDGWETQRIKWVKELLSYLRGIDSDSMIFVSSVIWQPQFESKDFLLLSDYFDFVCIHDYTKAVEDPAAAGDSTPVIRPALDSGRLVRYMTGNTVDSRPVLDLEFGPILVDSYDQSYSREDDEEVFHNVIWSEFASGTGGMALRWPCKVLEYNGPELTTAMINYQKNMADYFSKTAVSFKNLNSVPWERNTKVLLNDNVKIFASSNGESGLVYLLNDIRKNGSIVNGATLEIDGLIKQGEYLVEFWDTRSDQDCLSSQTVNAQGGSLSVLLPDFDKDFFLDFSYKSPNAAIIDAPHFSVEIQGIHADLSWNIPSGADGVTLYYMLSTSPDIGQIDMGTLTSLPVDLFEGFDGYAAVIAYAKDGTLSEFSNIAHIVIP